MQRTYRGKFDIAWAFIALVVIAAVNVLTFWEHYAGRMTFPWDFIGGYHTHAYAWYAEGSFFNPPKWFAWGDLGFPAYWALQSGAFYLPLAALDLLNIPYTFHLSTVLQCLHVLAGALGMYFFLRALGIRASLALLGALSFHFSSSFFSNAQHVDIIRAVALLPWLMWALHPDVLARSWLRPIIAALLLFQFLVAAYPGVIVATGYTLALVILLYLLSSQNRGGTRYLVATYVVVGASAISMAMLKWLPPIVEGDLLTNKGPIPVMALEPSLISTLILPFEKPFLANDVTMRSIWLPTAFLVGIAFVRRLSSTTLIAVVLIGIGLLFAGIGPVLWGGGLPLPGFRLSRFPLSDWRPALHIGLIVLACLGWENALSQHFTPKMVAARSVLALCAAIVFAWIAVGQGYTLSDLMMPGAVILLSLALLFSLALALSVTKRPVGYARDILVAAVCVLVIFQALNFYRKQNAVWTQALSPQWEKGSFDVRTSQLPPDRLPLSLERRPARTVFGANPQEIAAAQNSPIHNRCFYRETFCLLGYNNLRLSLPHFVFRNALLDPNTGKDLIAFASQPQRVLVLPLTESFTTVPQWASRSSDPFDSSVAGATGQVVGYGGSWARYRITTPTEVRVVENEIWTNGWSVKLCRDDVCRPEFAPEHTPQFLRTWTVPPGTWDVLVSFHILSSRYAWLFFYIGLGFSVLAGWFVRRSNSYQS